MCDLRAALSLRSVRRLWCGGAPAPLGSPLPAAVSGGGKDFLCDLRAALSLRSVRRLCFRRRSRSARFAASVRRRSRSRSVRRPLFSAALSLPLGSPPLVRRRSRSRSARRFGCGFRRRQRLFVRPSARRSRSRSARRFGRRFPAAAKTFCATFGRRSRSARFAALRRFPAAAKTFCATFGAAFPLAPGSPLCGGFRRRQRLFVRPFGGALARARLAASGGALARARFAALRRRSRSGSVRRFVAALSLALGSPLPAALSLRPGSPLPAAVSGGGKDFLCDLRAALSLTLVSPLPAAVSGGGKDFLCDLSARRSRSRSVRRFSAASSGGKDFLCDLRCGALAHARFAALCFRRRSRSRSVRRSLFSAALSLALGSPPSVSVRRFPAAEKALCATFRCGGFRRRQRLFVRPFGGGALAPLGSPPLVRRFPAALSLALGSPPSVSVRRFPAAAKTFCATFRRRSRSRSVRARAQSRAQKNARALF